MIIYNVLNKKYDSKRGVRAFEKNNVERVYVKQDFKYMFNSCHNYSIAANNSKS